MSADDNAGVSFVDAARRLETVILDWPVEYNGTIYDRLTVRRLTAGEVARFVEAIRALPEDKRASARLPMVDAPDAVLDSLDPDDDDKIDEVISRFLPRRFRVAMGIEPQSDIGSE